MDYSLIVKTLAELDIAEAFEWYTNISEHLPKELMADIDNSLESVKENPEHYQRRYGEVRIVFIIKFPYGIYYTIEENTVFVRCTAHQKN